MKHVGFCPECGVHVGDEELGMPCSRCGELLEANTLLDDVEAVSKQSESESISARYYPKSIPGVQRGSREWHEEKRKVA